MSIKVFIEGSMPAPTGVGVCWAPALGVFVSVGDYGVATSPDGIVWSQHGTPFAGAIFVIDVCWSSTLGLLVAVGSGSTNNIWTSTDAINWTGRGIVWGSTITELGSSVIWVADIALFIAGGSVNTGGADNIFTSFDGITWSSAGHPLDNGSSSSAVVDLIWSHDLHLAVALGHGVFDLGTNNWLRTVATSTNGTSWTNRGAPFASGTNVFGSGQQGDWSPTLGLFAAVADHHNGPVIYTSTDGITWTFRTAFFGGPGGQESLDQSIPPAAHLRWSPDLALFALTVNWRGLGGPPVTCQFFTSTDGISWPSVGFLGSSINTGVADMIWAPEREVFAMVGDDDSDSTSWIWPTPSPALNANFSV